MCVPCEHTVTVEMERGMKNKKLRIGMIVIVGVIVVLVGAAQGLRWQARRAAAETEAIVLEKAALLGMTMPEVLAAQGITLEELDIFGTGHYYDPVNMCHYGIDYDSEELPLDEQRCNRYSQRFSDMFGADGSRLIGDLQALYARSTPSFLWWHFTGRGPTYFMLPKSAGDGVQISVATMDVTGYVHPTNDVTLVMWE